MLLDALEISNVRSIETISFSLSEKVTVIVGKNGVGKSAILEAIALSLGQAPKRADPLRMDKDGNKTDHLTVAIDLKRQEGEAPTLAAPGPSLHIEYIKSSDGSQQWRVGQRLRTRKEVRTILSELGLDLHGSLAVVAQQDALRLAQLSPASLSSAIEQASGVKAFREAATTAKKELVSVSSEIIKIRRNISNLAINSRIPTKEQIEDAQRYLEMHELRLKWENFKIKVDNAIKENKKEQKRLEKEIKMITIEDKLSYAMRLKPDILLNENIKKRRQMIEEARRSVPIRWRTMPTIGNTLYFKEIDSCINWILVLSRILSPSKLNIFVSDTREEAITLARSQTSRVWALEAMKYRERKTPLVPGAIDLHNLVHVKLPETSKYCEDRNITEAFKQRILQGLPRYGVQTTAQAKELVKIGLDAATPDGTFYYPGRIDGGFVIEHSQLRSLIISFLPLPELPGIKYEEAMKDVLKYMTKDVVVKTPIHEMEVERLKMELGEYGHPVNPKLPSSLTPLLTGTETDLKEALIEILNRKESNSSILHERLKQLEQAATTLDNDVKRLSEKVSVAFTRTAELISKKFSASVTRCNPKLKAELKINAEEGKAWIEKDGEGDISQLSGGQKSLLAVCLSLAVVSVAASGCNLVILDEIDAALDDIAREGIRELLKDEFKDKQVILVTHHQGMVSEDWKIINVDKVNGVTHVVSESE